MPAHNYRRRAQKFESSSSRVVLRPHPVIAMKLRGKMIFSGNEGKIRFVRVTKRSRNGVRHQVILVIKEYKFSPLRKTYAQKLAFVKKHWELLNSLRSIDGLRQHVPATIRLMPGKKGHSDPALLLTDLTENGKYAVTSGTNIMRRYYEKNPAVENACDKMEELDRLANTLKLDLFSDAFLVTLHPETRLPVKVWICDAGGIESLK